MVCPAIRNDQIKFKRPRTTAAFAAVSKTLGDEFPQCPALDCSVAHKTAF